MIYNIDINKVNKELSISDFFKSIKKKIYKLRKELNNSNIEVAFNNGGFKI